MVERDVLFCVFTSKKRGFPVFFTKKLTEDQAALVAMKSQMTLSMMDSTELETAEAILPFSGLIENRIGFIYLFQIPQNDPISPNCVAALIYLVSQTHQAFLYSKVPFLKFKAEEMASVIQRNFVWEDNSVFPEDLQNMLSEWFVSEKGSTEIQIIEKKVTLSERTDGGSVDFFLQQIKKNADKALGGLYRGDPILVTGDSNIMIDMVVHSLDLFVPEVVLRKVSYTEDVIDPKQADIIGIDKKLEKRYPQEIMIDIRKGQVKNGKTCNYSKNIIKKIKKDPSRTDFILRDAYKQVLDVSGLLVEIFNHPETERDQMITDIQKRFDDELIEVAVELSAKRNPLIRELILQRVSNRFMDWIDGF
ncbi:MAG: hypothetical protein ACXACP_06335 [Candidatus Hodarchaeales archaeon]|jgi:hypothetical protein